MPTKSHSTLRRQMAKKRSRKSLDHYASKRDFEKSPEPSASTKADRKASSKRRSFVIQRHDARRLHYDLRIEMDGVLKSWAIPNGFSFNPKDKHLAIHVEDHPLEYQTFEGNIPAGEYGAGTMTIWDRGMYEMPNTDDGTLAIAAGKMEIIFFGSRLRGEFHMVRLKDWKKEWLLFKSNDLYARSEGEPAFSIDLLNQKKSRFPTRMESMIARRPRQPAKKLSSANDWLYEPMLAGRRVMIRRRDDSVTVTDLNGNSLEQALPGLVRSIQQLRARQTIVDGFLVCLNDEQRPSAASLEISLRNSDDARVTFYAMDLLYYEDWDLRSRPLSERKAALTSILPQLKNVVLVEHQRDLVNEFATAIQTTGLDGVLARRSSSLYAAGRSDAWQEIPVHAFGKLELQHRESTEPPGVRRSKKSPRKKVIFTNLAKTLWPKTGFTKGDLINYFDQIADVILPHLIDRPLSLNRWPNGIQGKSFFQKDTPDHAPDWIKTATVKSSGPKETIDYVLCNDRDTLAWIANTAAIELHPWLSRVGNVDAPDWAVLDLDPFGVSFEAVVAVAVSIHEVLQDAGIKSFPKTSGSKGLHIYVPWRPVYSWEQVRMFCEAVARLVVNRHRSIATVDRVKSKRVGKVYIDFLQNRRGQTVVAPYVPRPVEAASVSTPLVWDEVNQQLDPAQFNLQSVPIRLNQRGDLFAPLLATENDLSTAIDALTEIART